MHLGGASWPPDFTNARPHLSQVFAQPWTRGALNRLRKTVPEQALDASEYTRKTLLAGFTTVRDLGSSDFIDVGLRNAIRDGKIVGPRMLVAVHSIGSTGGHCDHPGGYRFGLFGKESGPEDGVANGPDAVRAAVRLNVKYAPDVIKTGPPARVLSL